MAGELVPIDKQHENLRTALARPEMQAQLTAALPRALSAERLVRLVCTEVRKNEKLLECSYRSLAGAVMEAAQLGLDIGTRGHSWLIPFKGEATLIIGYRGMIDLAYRSERVRSVAAYVVYEGDTFTFRYGTSPEIDHVPVPACDRESGTPTHAYAVIETTYGGTLMDVMAVEDLERIRERSRSKSRGPWVADYDEMCKKTVLRRLFKLAPCSTELQRAVTLDDQAEVGVEQHLGDVFTEEPVDVKSEPVEPDAMSCERCGDDNGPEDAYYPYDDGARCIGCGVREDTA